jgi:hypothetical protein
MSKSGARASGRIKRHPRRFKRPAKVRVADGVLFNQVNLTTEEAFQFGQQTKVRIGMFDRRQRQERHNKVEVAACRIERAGCGGPEYCESRNTITVAQCRDVVSVLLNQRKHGASQPDVGFANCGPSAPASSYDASQAAGHTDAPVRRYQASMAGRFLPSRGAGGRIERSRLASHQRVSAGSIVSSMPKPEALLSALLAS